MPVRNRSIHPIGNRRRRRSVSPLMEDLERRLVLSQLAVETAGFAEPTFVQGSAPYAMPAAGTDPQQINFYGASPQQLESAYGINQITFGSIKGDGAGQTVAIVDAYDNPGFLDSSDPNFGSSILAQYDQIFGLPNPPSFTKFNEFGGTAYSSLPPPSPENWAIEIAIDIEAVHLMAPAASIDLVEGTTNSNSDLFQAEQTAASLPGVSVVTNSWGGVEFTGQTAYDSIMTTPGVTFLASSGDGGAIATVPRGGVVIPRLVAERCGRGRHELVSQFGRCVERRDRLELRQRRVRRDRRQRRRHRAHPSPSRHIRTECRARVIGTVPDIAADADPTTGIALYDPYDFGAATPFSTIRRHQPGVTPLGRHDRHRRSGPRLGRRRAAHRQHRDPARPVQPSVDRFPPDHGGLQRL